MSLSKEYKEIIGQAREVEHMMSTKGWKIFKQCIEDLYMAHVGGVDKYGNLLGGAMDTDDIDIQYAKGYRKFPVVLMNTISRLFADRDAIVEQIKVEEQYEKVHPVNKFEELPNYE